MATGPMSTVLQHLRTLFGRDGAEMTDGELLTLFLHGREEAPLAALVRRHAAMVWGVCQRLLRNPHDAEDAFQATFLVLVRKADSVKPREAVGNWLYGVAHQTAVRVRAMAAKRGGREKQMVDMPEPAEKEAGKDDLLALLDQELSRLPDKHRLVIVLSDLEGKTRKEMARQLGISEGTVAGRLARAREMLARRLTRRGLAISSGALAVALSQSAATASVPAPLVGSTIKAASLLATGQAVSAGLVSANVVAITDGVVKAMLVSKIKSALVVVLLVGTVLGGVGVGYGLSGERERGAGGPVSRRAVTTPAKEEPMPAGPQVFPGTISKPSEDVATKAVQLLGHHGVLLIRSEARLNELLNRVPELTPDKPLPKIDFAKQSLTLVFALGSSSQNSLSLLNSDLTAKPPELGFSFRWYNGDVAGEERPSIKFIFAVIPAVPEVKVSVTSLPTNADRARPVTEFSAPIGGKDGGDIVDGLQAVVQTKADAIKPGEDILVHFGLHRADPGKARPEQFGPSPASIYVWDGKYSNGYRNHAFFVTTPDGKTSLLRPREIKAWDKNAPHPVAITATEPYDLPNWAEGDTGKSLKALGLDTTTPGTYTITGLYEEVGGEEDNRNNGKTQMWGGSITSNTITVEVKKAAE